MSIGCIICNLRFIQEDHRNIEWILAVHAGKDNLYTRLWYVYELYVDISNELTLNMPILVVMIIQKGKL